MEGIFEDLDANSRRLYGEKKYKEVEGMYGTFLKEAEGESEALRARAFNARAHAKFMQEELGDALKDYDSALNLDPSLWVAYYNRGTLKSQMGNLKDAISDLKTAVDKCPDNSEYRDKLKQCEEKDQ